MALPIPQLNILLAIADDWSFGHAGVYGCSWVRTPAFNRVAAEGLLFNRAYTPNAKCAPSRACILTGRNSWQLQEAGNHGGYFPSQFRTFPEALASVGYRCGYTGKGWEPGIALNSDGSSRKLIGPRYDQHRTKPPTAEISDKNYSANFSQFLDDCPTNAPWLFWYGSHEPHRPYTFGSGARLGGKMINDIEHVPEIWPDTPAVRHDLLDYAYECEYFDHQLGQILSELDKRGLAENTLVLVTSDNGMPFPRAKGQEYEVSNHLPLAIRWPAGIHSAGRQIDDFVSFIDFAPTILEAAGIPWAESGLAESPGNSLQNLFQAKDGGIIDQTRDHVLIGKERHDMGRPGDVGYPIRGIREGDWLYLRNFEIDRWPAGNPETGYLNCDGSPTKTEVLRTRNVAGKHHYWERAFGRRESDELYHIKYDPECLNNLAGEGMYVAKLERLRNRLFKELTEQSDPRMRGEGHIFDEYQFAFTSWRGYYERWERGEAKIPEWVNASDFTDPTVDTALNTHI